MVVDNDVYVQARSCVALSTREMQVSSLKNCWDILKCDTKTFVTLVTSAFPSAKVGLPGVGLTYF